VRRMNTQEAISVRDGRRAPFDVRSIIGPITPGGSLALVILLERPKVMGPREALSVDSGMLFIITLELQKLVA
jgi:hypothetical protein